MSADPMGPLLHLPDRPWNTDDEGLDAQVGTLTLHVDWSIRVRGEMNADDMGDAIREAVRLAGCGVAPIEACRLAGLEVLTRRTPETVIGGRTFGGVDVDDVKTSAEHEWEPEDATE